MIFIHTRSFPMDLSGLMVASMRAWQDGLDAIAITDHIEHRINQDLLNGDLNQSYKIAKTAADDMELIVIPGVEITRDKPLGHFNALFIQDANLIEKEDPLDSLAEAKKQGAFIVWNHPGWPDNNVTLYPIHEQLNHKRDHQWHRGYEL